eukprot:7516968-Pyramimonas_sp.AAC.1
MSSAPSKTPQSPFTSQGVRFSYNAQDRTGVILLHSTGPPVPITARVYSTQDRIGVYISVYVGFPTACGMVISIEAPLDAVTRL